MKPSRDPEKHVPLTLVVLTLTHLLDTGRFDSVTLDEVKARIADGTILRWLQTRTGDDDLGLLDILLDGKTYGDFERRYVTSLQAIEGGYDGQERRKWGVENRGICLLLAWTNEILQQGHGWLAPGEEAAGTDARSDELAVPPPWICDKCHRPIKTVEEGWVQWTRKKASIVHNREGCVYAGEDRSEALDGHLGWFLPGADAIPGIARLDGLDRLLFAIQEDGMPAKDGFEIIRRLYVPGYERAATSTPGAP